MAMRILVLLLLPAFSFRIFRIDNIANYTKQEHVLNTK